MAYAGLKRNKTGFRSGPAEPRHSESQFHTFLRQSTHNEDPIPLLKTLESVDLTEDEAKADHLSESFWSVGTKETVYDYTADDANEDKIVHTFQFTEATILMELLWLNEYKSPSPDEIPAKMLKELANELVKPLCAFPNILREGMSTT
ncbi:unnamed protein product [Dibothriocephalus latus]|uniref:Uncharacterized protein n=1 Tax=Dibothriocephalus latus TaxID=60516 RepID=A0A3P6P4M6_DIBLA|nr:unnamed protein product [Dibothriocephalus latus]